MAGILLQRKGSACLDRSCLNHTKGGNALWANSFTNKVSASLTNSISVVLSAP